MKLNPDCMRDVMLQIEKIWGLTCDSSGDIHMEYLHITTLYNTLPNYTKEDIYYTLFNLEQAGYLQVKKHQFYNTVSEYTVEYMTFAGHEFLNSIRDTQNWSKIKKGLKSVRNYSLDAISALAKGITDSAIDNVLKELSQ